MTNISQMTTNQTCIRSQNMRFIVYFTLKHDTKLLFSTTNSLIEIPAKSQYSFSFHFIYRFKFWFISTSISAPSQ